MYIIPKQVNLRYSAKPDCAWGGCGGHFPKWPLSQKQRGAEPSTFTVYVGFVRRRFQKKYWDMYHTTLSDIVKPFYKMAAISKVIRLPQKLKGAEPSMLTLYIGFVGRRFQQKYCRIHHANVSAILEAILQKWRPFLT